MMCNTMMTVVIVHAAYSIGSQTKAFHWGRSKTVWAALMVSRPAEWRSCLIESAHLVLGRPLGIFQPWMFGLKSKTLRTGREDGMRWICPNQRRRRCRMRDDAVGCLVHSRMLWLLMCRCQNTHRRRLWQRISNTSRRIDPFDCHHVVILLQRLTSFLYPFIHVVCFFFSSSLLLLL